MIDVSLTTRLEHLLQSLYIDHVQYLYETTSTNDDAKLLADKGIESAVCVAHKQTNGRGQSGRHWFSPEGQLYLSLLLPLNQSITGAFALETALTILQIPTFKKKHGLGIKWPNDLFFKDKKWGGILIEPYKNQVVIGIGINIFTVHLAANKNDIENNSVENETLDVIETASLSQFINVYDDGFDVLKLIQEICFGLVQMVYSLESMLNKSQDLATRFKPFDALKSRTVCIDRDNQPLLTRIKTHGIQSDGALLIQTESGITPLYSGHLQIDGFTD